MRRSDVFSSSRNRSTYESKQKTGMGEKSGEKKIQDGFSETRKKRDRKGDWRKRGEESKYHLQATLQIHHIYHMFKEFSDPWKILFKPLVHRREMRFLSSVQNAVTQILEDNGNIMSKWFRTSKEEKEIERDYLHPESFQAKNSGFL